MGKTSKKKKRWSSKSIKVQKSIGDLPKISLRNGFSSLSLMLRLSCKGFSHAKYLGFGTVTVEVGLLVSRKWPAKFLILNAFSKRYLCKIRSDYVLSKRHYRSSLLQLEENIFLELWCRGP